MPKFGLQMTNKNLNCLINPKSVALVGATERVGSVGAGLVNNLWEGHQDRKIFWINPNEKEIKGQKTINSILALKESVDLVIIAVPALIVPGVVKECCQKGVGAIIVISAGFAEVGEEGLARQQEIVSMAERSGIPLMGPNCLGLIRPQINLNASFGPLTPPAGEIAFISQSGALMNSVIDQSAVENYGFSNLFSYGNGADLSIIDFLWLADRDQQTKVIAVYLEGLKRGREFMEVAQSIVKHKPIVVLKSGRTALGQEAAASHTASLSGSDEVYRAAFRQSGVIVAETLEDLFDKARALSCQPRVSSGLGIITNGGGMGVLATDEASRERLEMPELQAKTISALKKQGVLPEVVSYRNPLDIIGDATTDRYQSAVNAFLSQKDINALVVIQTKQTMTNIQENMEVLVAAAKNYPKKAILSVCLPGKFSAEAIRWLEQSKIPNYSDPARAIRAARSLIS
jgi:acetyl coenzyme A synthetase (ADP forming)-like protein